MATEGENGDSVPIIRVIGQRVGDGIRALLRAGRGALSAALRAGAAARPPGDEPALRAITGGAALRARLRTEPEGADRASREGEALAVSRLDDDGGLLNESVDEDQLVLLPRDPSTVFVYWQLAGTTSGLREGSPQDGPGLSRHALQVEATDDDPAGTESWLVMLQPFAESCYVDLGRPRRSVRIVLGMHAEGGDFLPLVSSSPLLLPRRGRARSAPPRWRQLAFGAPESIAPPVPPTPETSETLCARALESDQATSGRRAWEQSGLPSNRDDRVARGR